MNDFAQPNDFAQTSSGLPLQPVYGPRDRQGAAEPPDPGRFPFTRGNYPAGYRGRLWTIRQYSGFGTAEESNRRYRYLLGQGGTGLSVALDLPTQCGYDSDDPEVSEEVGRVGVAIDTLADVEVLFDGIPLDRISTSFTINGTAAILLAFYVAAAERQKIPRNKLTGTIQNDILKEYASRGTWIWPPEPSLRLIADTIEFCAEQVPKFNAISVAGAYLRNDGASAVQEMAFTLADGVTYCDTVLARGRMTIEQFAPQVSFFFYTHGDFFEEIAKYRAGRRRWATIVKERYHATSDKAAMFRFGCVSGGASLYAPQARNNVIRVAYEAMASVLGGVQSMFTAAWDEPFALPSEESATLALRTQQILAYETGITRVADPLGGSFAIEALTDEIERATVAEMGRIREQGGALAALESGWLRAQIDDYAYQTQLKIERNELAVVGVNRFVEEGEAGQQLDFAADTDFEAEQRDRLAGVRARRSSIDVTDRLADVAGAARSGVNTIPSILAAVHASATLGEICAALASVWGYAKTREQSLGAASAASRHVKGAST